MSKHRITDLTETCTGCFACANSCPKDAISLPENYEGFYFPVIDNEKCIDCGLCDKVCPQVTAQPTQNACKAYYGWATDDAIRKTSSSGGLFHLLAQYVLAQNGIVYGAAFDYGGLVRLECHSTDEVTLEELQRSKYVQNHIGYAFRKIKKDLQANKKVLFCGTPCQAAGLKSYLRKEYDGLLLVDFICHGVPSMDLLRKHLDYLGIKHVKEIVFRPKNRGWVDDFEIRFSKNESAKPTDVKLRRIPWRLDEYFDIFQKYQNIRLSCRNCSYCNGERVSDVTLADFWRVKDYNPTLWDKRGVSLILSNSEKGVRVISELMEHGDNIIGEIPLKYASYVYERVRTDSSSPYQDEKRDLFLHDVYAIGYKQALEKNGLRVRRKAIIEYKLKQFIKSILRK